MYDTGIQLESLSHARGALSEQRARRVLDSFPDDENDRSNPTVARYKKLFRRMGSFALSHRKNELFPFIVLSNKEPVGIASITLGVSLVHGGEGQLTSGAELDYAIQDLEPGANVHLDVVSSLRDASDRLRSRLNCSSDNRYVWSIDEGPEGHPTRTLQKRYKSYVTASPSETGKIKGLELHDAFSRIEGVAPLETANPKDKTGVVKSHIGVVVFETK